MMGDPAPLMFELRRLIDHSEEAILAELRRVGSLLPTGAITKSAYSKHGLVGTKVFLRRFGSWEDALNAAGLGERFSGVAGGRGSHVSRHLSNEDVLESLRQLARRLDKTELTVNDVNQNLPFSGETLRKRWGTSRAAFEAAGLTATNLGRRYSDQECFDNLLTVWVHHGRAPKYREMGEPPSEVGGKAYVKRFDSWNKALSAFVLKVNSDKDTFVNLETDGEPISTRSLPDDGSPLALPDSLALSEQPQSSDQDSLSTKDVRDVPLGIRFRVLKRDRFRCVLCGDHPAANPTCVLHVDHVTPWSRGGKTREENLRTLCAPCNLGRGNRFTD